VSERVTLEAWTESNNPVKVDHNSDPNLLKGITGEVVRILEPLGGYCDY
jgi:5-oxoprolinase (ATP-hydrolysing)